MTTQTARPTKQPAKALVIEKQTIQTARLNTRPAKALVIEELTIQTARPNTQPAKGLVIEEPTIQTARLNTRPAKAIVIEKLTIQTARPNTQPGQYTAKSPTAWKTASCAEITHDTELTIPNTRPAKALVSYRGADNRDHQTKYTACQRLS